MQICSTIFCTLSFVRISLWFDLPLNCKCALSICQHFQPILQSCLCEIQAVCDPISIVLFHLVFLLVTSLSTNNEQVIIEKRTHFFCSLVINHSNKCHFEHHRTINYSPLQFCYTWLKLYVYRDRDWDQSIGTGTGTVYAYYASQFCPGTGPVQALCE